MFNDGSNVAHLGASYSSFSHHDHSSNHSDHDDARAADVKNHSGGGRRGRLTEIPDHSECNEVSFNILSEGGGGGVRSTERPYAHQRRHEDSHDNLCFLQSEIRSRDEGSHDDLSYLDSARSRDDEGSSHHDDLSFQQQSPNRLQRAGSHDDLSCMPSVRSGTLHDISELDSDNAEDDDDDVQSESSFVFQEQASASSFRPHYSKTMSGISIDSITEEEDGESTAEDSWERQQQGGKFVTGKYIDDDDGSYMCFRGLGVKPFVWLISAVATIGGVIMGFEIGATSATFLMPGFIENFGWCPADCTQAEIDEINLDQGLINGLFAVGAAIGALGSPWLADTYGRKVCMLCGALLSLYSSTRAFATKMAFMILARFVAGLGVGCFCMCSPVYVAELAPSHARGVLTTLYGFAMTGGVVLSSGLNLVLQDWEEGWRIAHGGTAFFAVILILSLITFMPESPRWLLLHDRKLQALENMRKTRLEDELSYEIHILHLECAAETEQGTASWQEMFSPESKMRRRVLLGIGLQVVQQFSGINAIMFYAPVILKTFMGTHQAILGAFFLNVLNFLSTFITIPVVDRVGRTTILMIGGLVMTSALVLNSFLASIRDPSKFAGNLVILASAVYIISFACSWGPVVWTMCAEMFPMRARGKGAGLSSMANWVCASLMGLLFPIAASTSMAACFAFFAVVTFLGVMMVQFFLVETAGRSIAEIDEAYENHKLPTLASFFGMFTPFSRTEQQQLGLEKKLGKREAQQQK